jgi:hypothetical protein
MQGKSPVTLRHVARTAAALSRFRGVFIVTAVLAGLWFGWRVIDTDSASARALVPLAVLLWSVLALGIGYLLPRQPPAIRQRDRMWVRVKKRLVAGAYVVAVFAALLLGLFALMMSVRALNLSA